MISKQLPLLILSIMVFILTGSNAFSNGINPQRPKEVPVSVKFIDKSNDIQGEFFRVRIKVGDNYYYSISTEEEEFPLIDIKTITLLTDEVNSKGFLESSLVLEDGSELNPVMLKVKTVNDENIELSGFNENGRKDKIALLKCREVKFDHAKASNFNHGLTTGK